MFRFTSGVLNSKTSNSSFYSFGLAVSADYALIGPRFGNSGGGAPSPGYVYVYNPSTGQQMMVLSPNDASFAHWFGGAIAVEGQTAVVGAFEALNAGVSTGAAFVFDLTTGQQTHKLVAPDAAKDDLFARAIDISGSLAILGARYDDDLANRSGSAYIFDTNNGQMIVKLLPNDGIAEHGFGESVAIDGNIAVVGAVWDNQANVNAGAAYVFDATTGEQLFKLVAPDARIGDLFGNSVAIDDGLIAVGALEEDLRTGAVYLFESATGKFLEKIKAHDGNPLDQFGEKIALDGRTLLVAAPYDDDLGSNSGSAYLYTSVPEPASATLLALAGLILTQRRRAE